MPNLEAGGGAGGSQRRRTEFKHFVLANPAAVEQLGAAVAIRQTELDHLKAQSAGTAASEPPQRLIDRIRKFFGVAAA